MRRARCSRADRLRQKIDEVKKLMLKDIRVMAGAEDMVKGCLSASEHTCGKPNCRCAKGELHHTWVLSYSGKDGKQVNVCLREEQLNRYRGPAEQYRAFREARARLAERQRLLLDLFNQLEAALLIEPPKLRREEKSLSRNSRRKRER